MRFLTERLSDGLMLRVLNRDGEIAYGILGLKGLCAEIEFPSDWHEQRRAWVRLSVGILKVCFSFPWSKVVPDEYQCSGPTYGFTFFGDGLHVHWGKCKGTRDDPMKVINMPWMWRHIRHEVLERAGTHSYRYVLNSGEVQNRWATIQVETREWIRPWFPFYKYRRYINVEFNDEVGERSGSWKGGCIACGYEMKPWETPLETLRRMEKERKF